MLRTLIAILLAAAPVTALADGTPTAGGQCVEGKRCDFRYPSTGVCNLWLTFTECGPVCVAGDVCDLTYDDGRCASYRTDAVCGDRCSKQQVCRLRYDDGRCAETEFKLSCTNS